SIAALAGNSETYDTFIKALLERGRLSTSQLIDRNTQSAETGGEAGSPTFYTNKFFKEAVLDASPRALKFLNSQEGKEEKA
ncbi:hypothetical protein ABTH20_21370, partial [Acinetobacter baumannii]